MAVTWITPVEVTPGTASSWQDVDVSSYVSANATGVILHIVYASTQDSGWRKNGSTDNRTTSSAASHQWCTIGVDASRIFEAYVGSTTDVDIYLVGYFEDESVFFTNAVDKSLTTTSSWQDISIASDTGADTAIGACFEITYSSTFGTNFGMRMNGSSVPQRGARGYHSGYIIGVDASEILEGYIGSTSLDFFLVGYIKDTAAVTFYKDSPDWTNNTTTWQDMTALPTGATGAFFEVDVEGGNSFQYGVRKNGSAEDIMMRTSYAHGFAAVECDASQLIEAKESQINTIQFYLIGYTGVMSRFKEFTADALLKATLTKTFTADALVGFATYTKTFTVDAILKATSTKTFSADALLKSTTTKVFTADAVLILSVPLIVSPKDASVESSPVYMVATSSQYNPGAGKKHFNLQIDKTSSAFGDIEIEANSFTSQTNWQYWDGAAWQSMLSDGLDSAYFGNNVRYQATLTAGSKWWRIRELNLNM